MIPVLLVDRHGQTAERLQPLFVEDFAPVCDALPPQLALEAVRQHRPRLVLLDVAGDDEAALKLVRRIMADVATPIVILAEDRQARRAALPLLEAGALDVLETGAGVNFSELRRQLKLLAAVPVVSHPDGRKLRTNAAVKAVRAAAPQEGSGFPLVAVACSLGGPPALAVLLKSLPKLRAPVVICQHITPGFSDDLALWLAATTGHVVHEAADGQHLLPGEFFIAPAGRHMLVRPGGVARLDDSAPVGGFKPSADVLLTSVAQCCGVHGIGVVLTGMGRDGAQGLHAIRRAGGHTVAQNQETSVVFGMPGEAVSRGAAEQVLPLNAIGPQLVEWLS